MPSIGTSTTPCTSRGRGGERGDPYLIEETDDNHRRADEAARAFLSDLHDAITELNYQLQETLRGEMISDARYPHTGFIEEALERGSSQVLATVKGGQFPR